MLVKVTNMRPELQSKNRVDVNYGKGLSENLKKMSWDNLISPIDAKNSVDVNYGKTFGLRP